MTSRSLGIAALVVACSFAFRAPALADVVLIQGGTVLTDPRTRLEDTDVLLRDGRVAKIAKRIAAPDGATVVSVKGQLVSVGLIDVYDSLGLVDVELEETAREGQFGDERGGVHAAYRVVDGYNPRSVAIPVARVAGVTSSVVVPRGGLIGGVGAWMSLGHELTLQQATIALAAGMQVTVGAQALGVSYGSRGVAIERLRELLSDAKEYLGRKAAYERNQSRTLAASRLDLEALGDVVTRRIPLLVHADRATDIQAVLSLASALRVRLVIVGGVESWLLAKELAAAKVPVVLDPSRNLPSSFDQLHVVEDLAARLAKAGVPVIVSVLGDQASARTLRQLAGMAVARGLPWELAFGALTQVPADVFGDPSRGVLRVGGPADVVVWSGDPLELSTRVVHVFIGGVAQPMVTHQTRLRDRYR